MKQKIFLLLSLAIGANTVASYAQKAKPFNITGRIKSLQDGYISFTPFGGIKGDTVQVKNEIFTYNGNLAEAEGYMFNTSTGVSNLVFLEPGKHDMQIGIPTANDFTFSNGIAQANINTFISSINPLVAKRNALAAMPQTDSVNLVKQQNEVDIQNVYNGYIKNPKSHPVTTAFLTLNNLQNSQGMGVPQMQALANNLSPAAKLTAYGKKVTQIIGRYSADDIGNVAPDFTLLDSAGNKISLSQFKGKKYVLVDFWATWCGPCRGEFPHLKEAYEKYKNKDFVILGVSIDSDKKKWQSMIAQPGYTPWLQVYDGPGPNQVASTIYTVPSIPRNFLIDKNGVVIAKNLRGPAVMAQLATFLK
jgi:thiol-disulfide isomerase/thioredoxin